ncbi:MAG: alpha/beta fold hydrolase [Acidobacteriaceae bacterium]|nr:alpha/beta fold hydrolase [Acidobacteriaceae bacterium]
MSFRQFRILYLHGFASGPQSRKATFFSEHLRSLGFEVDVPALDEGNFESLTISGQLRVVARFARNERVALIGSSLGGYIAALYAARHSEVERLILLAPAFQFYNLWMSSLGEDQLSEWRERGKMNVFHYATGRGAPIGYELIEDASRFEPFPDFTQPALIFHGNHDASVPVQYSAEFVSAHSNARLVRLESGHELTDVLDQIWQESKNFLMTLRL